MSNSAYPGLTAAEDAFKTYVWDIWLTMFEAWLYGAAPYLAPFSFILNRIFSITSNKVFAFGRLVVDMTAIPLVNKVHEYEYKKAALKLQLIEKQKGTSSPEYLKAREDEKASFSKFVHTGP